MDYASPGRSLTVVVGVVVAVIFAAAVRLVRSG
jgi:hypothetical protein